MCLTNQSFFKKENNFCYTGYDTDTSQKLVSNISNKCFKYCKTVYEKSNQQNFNFFGSIYGHVKFFFLPNSNICVLDSELPCNRNIESRRLLLTLFFHEQGRSSLRKFITHASLLE